MTKVYLVKREIHMNGNLVASYVSSVFTNKTKALSLKRYLEACDKLDEIEHPKIEGWTKNTTVDVTTIDNLDYTKFAIEKETKLLPY